MTNVAQEGNPTPQTALEWGSHLLPRVVWPSSHSSHSAGAGTVVGTTASCWGGKGGGGGLNTHTPGLSDITRRQASHFTSADVGASGDVFGEVCGDLVVEVWGGVPGSDADFSVSFCVQANTPFTYFLHVRAVFVTKLL